MEWDTIKVKKAGVNNMGITLVQFSYALQFDNRVAMVLSGSWLECCAGGDFVGS